MKGYAVYELTPAPWGLDYRYIVMRDERRLAEEILEVLKKTDYNCSTYKIIEFDLGDRP